MTQTVRPVARLGIGLRMWLRIKHTFRLGREVGRYGAEQRMWWIIPTVAFIALLALAVTSATTALPVAVYTLF